MKKLMLGMAIAAVGTAFAVESANIVGYATSDIRTESAATQVFTLMSVPFTGVTDANIPADRKSVV